MTRVPPTASPVRTARRKNVSLAFTGAILVLLLAAGLVQAVAVTVGFRDFQYDPGQASRATADAQQSKLWFANNAWYGGFYSSADNSFNIWRLNETTHVWADSHIVADERDRVHGDYLFDTANNKLYTVSTKSPCTSMTNGCNDGLVVTRYTFHPASALGAQYTVDAGFPVTIIGGLYNGVPPSAGGAETVTIAKDADRVYVAWTRRTAASAVPSATWVAYSTNAGQTTWSAPFLINAGEDGQSNISAIVSFGTKVGIYYTDAHSVGADTGLFKVHTGGAAGDVWSAPETAAASSVDNQASVKSDGTNVFVGYKTRAGIGTSAQISLLKRDGAGTWTGRGVSDVDSANVRPQVAIDTEFNGGAGALFVIMNEAEAASLNGNVYYKLAPLTGAGALTFTLTGKGVTLIDSATDNDIEDATTTKQILNEASGLVVEATDKTSKFYLHNLVPLPAAADNTGPVGTVVINNNPTPDATKVTAVNLAITATDVNGVVSMNIINSPDGTTCPTSGSPALLVGGTPEPYATTKAWALSAGDAVKRVCIQFLDDPLIGTGNWSVPVSDTIRLDTTAPAGTVTINGGDASTTLATVSVAVPATDATGVANVRLSNSAATTGGVLTTGTTFPYATPQPWTLTPNDGVKTVYVQWQDSLGTWSAVSNDTITLDSVNTTYTEVTPVRVLDSRENNPAGAHIFSHGVPQSFKVAGRTIGAVTIPADAVAVTGNLTVVGSTAAGFVSLGPDVKVIPDSSTINFTKGDTRANGVFVPLDGSGNLEATYYVSSAGAASQKTHLVLDVTGYFRIGTAGNEYFPVTPARYLDTRVNNPGGAHILNPSVPYAFQVGGRTVGSTTIPADAVAITGNLTVTGQTKGGFLSLTPDAQANPTTSTLNFPVKDTRANNVTVKLGAGGNLYVVYKGTGKAHAILDITGYFRNDVSGLSYVPVTPTRTVDTRLDQGIVNPLQASAPKSWTVRGFAGVESDAKAFTGNLTITAQTKGGFISVTPTPNASPSTSTLNFPVGDSRANGIAAPINDADGKSSVVYKPSPNSGHVEFIVDITGYFH